MPRKSGAMTRPAADTVEHHLTYAKAKSDSAIGLLLDLYRPYLLAIAAAKMDRKLSAKDGASDLVQRTFEIAHRRFEDFAGSSEIEVRYWLRGILLKVIGEWHRRYKSTERRSIHREVSLNDAATIALLDQFSANESKSPGQRLVAAENEQALRAALQRLPEHYRRVILWRVFRRRSFKHMAEKLDRSMASVRMLYYRAVRELAKEMKLDDRPE